MRHNCKVLAVARYYTMTDMLKAGIPVTVVLVVLCAIWLPIASSITI